ACNVWDAVKSMGGCGASTNTRGAGGSDRAELTITGESSDDGGVRVSWSATAGSGSSTPATRGSTLHAGSTATSTGSASTAATATVHTMCRTAAEAFTSKPAITPASASSTVLRSTKLTAHP